MNPAYSVILFTTASGAGYGLLVWLAASAAIGRIAPDFTLGFFGLGLALALITSGLVSSTFHLGRPERAWRAFSQWRTSWLSREGVLAVATYVPAAFLFFGWIVFATFAFPVALAAWLTALLALATVFSTAMIYASLPTVRAWNQNIVPPIYLVLSLATGGVLYNILTTLIATPVVLETWLTILLLVLAWVLKATYWSAIDGARRTLSTSDAIGLGKPGGVKQLDPPHSAPNFVMREMGYRVARKHASRLRQLTALLLFLVPALGLGLLLTQTPTLLTGFLTVLTLVATAAGIWLERWLFFAEAQHVVTLYYGAEEA